MIKHVHKYWWLVLLLTGGAVYALAMLMSAGQSIWFDESYSILLAQSDLSSLLALSAVDTHPPLYYINLKIWMEIFGSSEFALRSLSAVFAGVTVAGAALIIKKLFSAKSATLAIPLLVLSPFVLRYGYEIRMYSMAAALVVLATLALIYARQSKKWWPWLVYAVLVALGTYTLYAVVFVWLAHFVWLVIDSAKTKKLIFKQKWLYSYVLAAVLFLPQAITFVHQMSNSVLPGIGSELGLSKLVGIFGVLTVYSPEWQVGAMASLGLLLVIFITGYLIIHAYGKLSPDARSNLLLVILLAVLPMILLMLLTAFKPDFVYRYIAHLAIFYPLLIGVAVSLGFGHGKQMLAAVLMITTLGLLVAGMSKLQVTGNFNFERMQYPETSALRDSIDCHEDTVIVADDPYTYIDIIYYFKDCDVRFYSADEVSYRGGYAPLNGSTARIESSLDSDKAQVIHIYWGGESKFLPDARYELGRSTVFGKQVADVYYAN